MEQIYNQILNAIDLQSEYESFNNKKLKAIFAFLCACMAYNKMITLNEEFAAELYIDIVNYHDILYPLSDKIYDFIDKKSLDEMNERLTDEIDAFEKGEW